MTQESAQPPSTSPDGQSYMQPTVEDLQQACGHTIALVLAPNAEAKDNLEEVARVARDTRAPAIFVMADMSCADEAISAVRSLQRKGRTMMQAAEFDFSTAYGDDTENADFHLEELPRNMMEVMRVLSESVLDVYESILIIDASQSVPTVEELYNLCFRLRMGLASGEVFVHQDATPSPYAISRVYLDELEAVD